MCEFCLNSFVDDYLTPDNDLGYLSVGDSSRGYSMHIRSGDNRPTVLIVSTYDNELECNIDVCTYKMKYCPECGRRLFENF